MLLGNLLASHQLRSLRRKSRSKELKRVRLLHLTRMNKMRARDKERRKVKTRSSKRQSPKLPHLRKQWTRRKLQVLALTTRLSYAE